MRAWRWLPVWAAAALLIGCTRMVSGTALLPPTQTPGPMLPPGVDVHQIMLDTARMRAITGAGDNLTIIPTMDTTSPVDVGPLAETLPPPCRFVYAETAIFGADTTQFHKTTFQYPRKAALISEAAAAYRDVETARRAFEELVATVVDCAQSSAGATLVGDVDADADSLRTRSGRCGSDYRLKAAVLLEVTVCGFSDSVSELVLTNLADRTPG